MKSLKLIVISILLMVIITSCNNKNKLTINTKNIAVKVSVKRFDQMFFKVTPKTLPKLKSAFPYLFPAMNPDSVWLNKLKNPDFKYLYKETQKVFPDFKNQTKLLTDLFKHVKYYYPKFKAPKVVTLISELDLSHQVIYADSLLLISLDTYLGSNNKVYAGYPKYLRLTYDKRFLLTDVAKAISLRSVPKQDSRSFISSCIQQGKLLYQSKSFVPDLQDSILLKNTKNQLLWAKNNQEFVWKYFISKKLIFNNNKDLLNRFIYKAPFSKFYLDIDQNTPGSIGSYIGYEIVSAFMKNNNVSLRKMIITPNEILFKKSKYKPRNQ